MTVGELTDTIIAKDFSSNPLSHRPQFLSYQDSIATTDQWKYRRMIAKDEVNKNNQMGRVTPDERQIIRMAQPPSPRKSGGMYHEPVSPMDGHFIQGDRRQLPPHSQSSSVPSGGEFQLDRYMSSKIVEAMRTPDEKSRQDERDNERHSHMTSLSGHNKDLDRSSTPGEMIIDEDRGGNVDTHPHPHHHHHQQQQQNQYAQQSMSQQQQQPQPQTVTTFATTTYAYPYNALNVGAGTTAVLAGQSAPTSIKMSNQNTDNDPIMQRPTQTLAAEPKPLLSAQYEALSDED